MFAQVFCLATGNTMLTEVAGPYPISVALARKRITLFVQSFPSIALWATALAFASHSGLGILICQIYLFTITKILSAGSSTLGLRHRHIHLLVRAREDLAQKQRKRAKTAEMLDLCLPAANPV